MRLFTALLLLNAGLTYAAPKISERNVVIQGEINRNVIEAGDRLEQLAQASKEPIDIILNSPGGAVIPGFLFINRMNSLKAQGIKLRCYVQDFAASMAFQILMHCNERHILERSFLLWHRVRVQVGGMFGQPITAPEASKLSASLQAIDDLIIEELVSAMPQLDRVEIMYHLEDETLHTGITLGRAAPKTFTVHKYIPGLYKLLQTNAPKSPEGDLRLDGLVYRTTKIK
jgi:ATP-dependent protease ClpP protease subunit